MKPAEPIVRSIIKRVIPLTVLVLLIVICASRWFAGNVVNNQVMRRLELASSLKANQITDELNDLHAALRSLANNHLIVHSLVNVSLQQDQLPAFFRSLQLPNTAFRRITMTDYAGRPLVSNVESGAIDVSPYMTALVDGMEVTRLDGELIWIACPIEFTSQKMVSTEGVLAAEYDTREFLDRFRGSSKSHRYRVFLDNKLIYSDRLEQDFAPDTEWLSASTHIQGSFALRVEQAELKNAAFASLQYLDWFLVGVFIFSLAAIAGTTWLSSKIVTSPLDRLIDQISRIENQQDLSRSVPVEGPLELQKLTTSFNLMIAALSETTVSLDELQRTKKMLHLALNGGNIGMWRWNVETDVVDLSKELSAQLGEKVAFNNYSSFLARLHPDDVAATRASVESCLQGVIEKFDMTFRLRHRNGSYRWILSRGRVTQIEAGKRIHMTGVHIDITDRIEAEENTRAANQNLARSNEELAQFAYVASHDLQEPLRKVLSFAELLDGEAREQLTDDAKLFLSYIVDGAQRMRTLIQDLLAFSRVESDGRQLTEVDSQISVNRALSDLELAIQESGAKIEVGTLPLIWADTQQLNQLFQNLISNAIKYSERAPRISITATAKADFYEFRVSDNGIGIQKEYHDKVFGIFKRLHGRGMYAGNGIGLAICRRIVDRLGGTIWIEPNQPHGTCFAFTLKASPEPACVTTGAAPELDMRRDS